MINWGALQQGGAQNALAMGLQMGQMVRQQQDIRDYRNAMIDQRDRQITLQEQQAQAQAGKDRRADLPMVTRLLETATDQATYERNMGVAQQYGLDVSNLPRQFDPAWRDSQLTVMRSLQTPEAQQALSTIGKEVADMGFQPGTPQFNTEVTRRWEQTQSKTIPFQPGGNVIEYNAATGQARPLVQGAGQPMPQPMPQAPRQQAPAQLLPRAARPAGMTDDQLFAQAREAVEQGASVDAVFQQLREWGVEVN